MDDESDRSRVTPGESLDGPPFRRSWIDALLAAVDRLPGPAYAVYLVFGLLLALMGNGLRWLDGTLAVGTFNALRTGEAFFAPVMLASIHYLDRIAVDSLQSFQPLLGASDSTFQRLRYELRTMPARSGLVIGALGIVLGVQNVLASPEGYGLTPANGLWTQAYVLVFASLTSVVGVAFMFHTARQLLLVNRIHSMAANLDLFQGSSLYSFSRLTWRSGLALLLQIYGLVGLVSSIRLQDPSAPITPVTAAIVAGGSLLAVATFILPLYGVHLRLAQEKSALIEQNSRRIRDAADQLHHALGGDDLVKVEAMEKAISGLARERELLVQSSTWPWPPRTVRGFASAIALPIVLFLITRALDRALGP